MPVAYDQDADQVHAPGGHDSLGVSSQQAAAEVDALEKQYAADSAPEPKTGKSTDSSELKKDEEAPDRSGFSAADDINEKLGRGYTGKGSTKSKGLAKLFSSKSSLKKKIALAGAASGGSALIGIMIFFAMLPLKIEHIVNNLESHYSAASQQAIGNETDSLFSSYMTKKVLPNLKRGACKSTIDARCVALDSDTSTPIGKLFQSWKQGKLENKLATKYDLAFGYKNGQLYLNRHGSSINLGSGDNIFGDSHTKAATRSEVRQAVRSSLKEATLYDKVFTRFKIGKLLESKYGVKRCLIACNIRDNFNDKLDDKRKVAKAFLIQRVISPLSGSLGLIMQCIIGSGNDGCTTNTDENSQADGSGDQERTSAFQRRLDSQLASYAEKYGAEKLDKLLADAADISEGGFGKYIFTKIGEKLGISVATDKALDAIPIIGQINLVATIVGKLDSIGPKLKALTYATSAAAAVQLYMSYRTVADEAKSGHMDATELSSFTDQLSNLAKDDNGNTSDASATPLYNELLGGGTPTTASIFGSLFGGKAFAASTSNSYKCNDKGSVPANKLVCDEEKLNGGAPIANAISNIENKIPGWPIVAHAASLWNGTVGDLYNTVGKYVSDVAGWLLDHLGISSLISKLGSLLQPVFNAIIKYVIPTPFSDTMSGGRTFDMMAAGSDVGANKSCEVQLGCGKISSVAAANIQNQQLAEAKQEFDSKSLFARMFDTDSSYSLVSRLAMDMPTTMLGSTTSGLNTILSNPVSGLFSGFSSLFSSNHAFAATSAQDDPFGVTQYGYTSVPDDPEAFWSANCVTGPLAKYDSSTGKLDVSDWLNSQTDNPETGEAEPTKPNACLLIQSSIQSAGGIFDPSLLPTDTQNDNTDTSNTGAGSQIKIATFNVLHSKNNNASARMAKESSFIAQQNFDVVGLQELEGGGEQRSDLLKGLKDAGQNWEIWPKRTSRPTGAAENSIIWNTDRFTETDEGVSANGQYRYFNNANLGVPWVKLKDNGTGQEFIVQNTHDPADEGGDMVAARSFDAKQHLADVQKWSHQGLPVFVTGDFNSTFYSRGSGKDPASRSDLPYCLMTSTGELLNSYDVSGNIGSPVGKNCPSPQNDKQRNELGSLAGQYGNWVDHIYITPQVQVGSLQRDNTLMNASPLVTDHPVMWINAILPGSSTNTGAGSTDTPNSAGWVWPIAKSDYHGLSECWNAVYNGGHHAGQDIVAASSTNVYAAHNGTVVSYGYNYYGGNTLLVNAGGGLWYNYQHLESSKVKAGDKVAAGQLVASSDNTGHNTTGAHLHFGIAVAATTGSYADNSQTRDPLGYLPKDRDEGVCK